MNSDIAPVSEVCLAVQFAEPLGVTPDAAIAFYQSIFSEYPHIQFKAQIPDLGVVAGPIFGMGDDVDPRYFFISGDDVRLVQLQNDMIAFNWRRRPMIGASPVEAYPGYEGMKQRLDAMMKRICEHLKAAVPPVRTCNLFYDDVWPTDGKANYRDTFAFWNKIGVTTRGRPNVSFSLAIIDEALEADARVDVTASAVGMINAGQIHSVNRLLMSGVAHPKDRSFSFAAFDTLHDCISTNVGKILSEQALQGWYNV